MMRAVRVFILFIALFVFQNYESVAQCPLLSAVTIDGNADEWPMNWQEEEERNFSYNICADDQNLFVRIRTTEFYTKRKMAAFGFTLWFDTDGKKKRTYGLKFPVGGAEAEERMGALNKEAAGMTGVTTGDKADFQKHADEQLIKDLEVLELIGIADDPVTATRSGITNGIKVAIAMDELGAYVYEVIIPFKSYRLSRASIKELMICFETGKLTAPKKKPTTKNAPLAGGEYSPSELSRMQGYDNMKGNPKLIYPTTYWTKVQLNQ